MKEELLHQIALTSVPNVGAIHARILIEEFGTASDIFKSKEHQLRKIEGIGAIRAHAIKSFNQFDAAEKEIKFIEDNNIQPLFISDGNFPQRLRHCVDCPVLLYYRGNADLNGIRMIAVVGTRKNSPYGQQITERLVAELASYQPAIISGLAYGIDAIAHEAALQHQLPTIGVLAHGLDKIYPMSHKSLSREMVDSGGGLLTEFRSGHMPDRHHFPIRNRIVAGLCDATIVVETGVRGGSMITAELANDYNRDVFAFPGRVMDDQSRGCHYLVKENKAMLISEASDVITIMKWTSQPRKKAAASRKDLQDLTEEEKAVTDLLQEKEKTHIDELKTRSSLSSSTIAKTVLNLEMKQLIMSHPGNMYSIP